MLATAIKICGITTSAALDACLSAQATHVGLVFFPKSPRNIDIAAAAALATQASSKAKVVGLFVDPQADFIDAVRDTVRLDVIQLHGSEPPAFVSRCQMQHGLEVWKAIGVKTSADLAQAHKYVGAATRILYDAKPPAKSDLPGGTGLQIDWSIFAGVQHRVPWILAGGLTAGNVAEAMARTGADFVDTSSGVESAPGVKDVDKIAAFCKAARNT
jgi:phosphoribosylanthranilate isomerase